MQDSPEPREIELKLECEPDALDRIRAHPLLSGAGAQTKHLRNTYFDTPGLALREAGIALRLRQDGDRLIQTVKIEGSSPGVAFDRAEWEEEVDPATPDFRRTLPDAVREQLDGKLVRKLRPVFEVTTERMVTTVEHEGSRIEVALDAARIVAGPETIAFSEIELELKSGEAKALFALALELAKGVPLRIGARTKSDRGYRLLDGKPPRSVKARDVPLDRRQSTASAIQSICASCLRQLIENETIVRERPNPDALHQARVGVRRLRAALSLFKDIVADDEVAAIRAELKWIGEQLGTARDLDVFIARTLEPAVKAAKDPGEKHLLEEFRQRRDKAYQDALEVLDSERYRRAVLTTAAWIEAGAWILHEKEGPSDPRNVPVESFAASEMERRWRRTRVRLKGVEKLDEEARHRVRIEMKKIRYAAEFFGSVFREGRQRQFRSAVKILEEIQATLGNLNDIAVGRAIAGTAMPERAENLRAEEVPALLKQARQQAKEFRSIEAFWTTG